jgi:hypothetical protein
MLLRRHRSAILPLTTCESDGGCHRERSNAAEVKASGRLLLVMSKPLPATPLQLSCVPLQKDSISGQQLHVECESTNPGNTGPCVVSGRRGCRLRDRSRGPTACSNVRAVGRNEVLPPDTRVKASRPGDRASEAREARDRGGGRPVRFTSRCADGLDASRMIWIRIKDVWGYGVTAERAIGLWVWRSAAWVGAVMHLLRWPISVRLLGMVVYYP